MTDETIDTTTEKPKRGRPKGLGRVPGSGRRRGTPNKRTAEIRELLLSLKCDPIQGMARIAMNIKNSADLRGRMFAELAQYTWPKRKAIEHIVDAQVQINKIERVIVRPEKPAEAPVDSPVVPDPEPPPVAEPPSAPEIPRPDPPPQPRSARDKMADQLDAVDCLPEESRHPTDMEKLMRQRHRR